MARHGEAGQGEARLGNHFFKVAKMKNITLTTIGIHSDGSTEYRIVMPGCNDITIITQKPYEEVVEDFNKYVDREHQFIESAKRQCDRFHKKRIKGLALC